MIELQLRSPEEEAPGSIEWLAEWPTSLAGYALLLRLVIENRISAGEFELLFDQRYGDDPTEWNVQVLDVLEALHDDIGDRRANAELRSQTADSRDRDLRDRAVVALSGLSSLRGPLR